MLSASYSKTAGGARAAAWLLALLSSVSVAADTCRDFAENSYRQVLLRLAQGDRAGAALDLEDLYRGDCFVSGAHDRTVLSLATDLQKLRLEDPGFETCLLPVLHLHLDTFEALSRGGKVEAADRSLEVAERLLELHRDSAEGEAGPAAARAQGRIGWVLRDLGRLEEARPYFREALTATPVSSPLMYLSATLDEKLGDYDSAATTLARLGESTEIEPEVLLRWALAEARRGRDRRARDLLGRTLSDGAEPWVQILAYQERVRLEAAEGEPEAARQVAEEALGRFPEDQGLKLQWSQLSGEWSSESHRLLEQLTRSREEPEEVQRVTPRVLYNEWPGEEQRLLEAEIEDEVEESLASLAGALRRISLPGAGAGVFGGAAGVRSPAVAREQLEPW